MLLIVSAVVPVLVNVAVCDALDVPTIWLANVKLAGDKLTAGTAAAVPVSDTVCGLEAALSLRVIAPVSVPEAVGVNVTEMLQLAFGCQTRTAGIGLRIVPRRGDAADRKSSRACVGQPNCLRRAGCSYRLAGKRQACRGQTHPRRIGACAVAVIYSSYRHFSTLP